MATTTASPTPMTTKSFFLCVFDQGETFTDFPQQRSSCKKWTSLASDGLVFQGKEVPKFSRQRPGQFSKSHWIFSPASFMKRRSESSRHPVLEFRMDRGGGLTHFFTSPSFCFLIYKIRLVIRAIDRVVTVNKILCENVWHSSWHIHPSAE